MRILIQRVKKASVTVNGKVISAIDKGLLLLLGIEESDTQEDISWISSKVSKIRIFNDENKQMNYSVQETDGEILVVSQFTLLASTKKGNRPSYTKALKPEPALKYYEAFIKQLEKDVSKKIQSGKFGASMEVESVNDGPVTIIIDSKQKE